MGIAGFALGAGAARLGWFEAGADARQGLCLALACRRDRRWPAAKVVRRA